MRTEPSPRGTKRACMTVAAALTLGLALLGVAACGQETSGESGGGGTAPSATPSGSPTPVTGPSTGHGPTSATASPPTLPTSLPVSPTTYPGPRGSSPNLMTHGPAPSK